MSTTLISALICWWGCVIATRMHHGNRTLPCRQPTCEWNIHSMNVGPPVRLLLNYWVRDIRLTPIHRNSNSICYSVIWYTVDILWYSPPCDNVMSVSVCLSIYLNHGTSPSFPFLARDVIYSWNSSSGLRVTSCSNGNVGEIKCLTALTTRNAVS